MWGHAPASNRRSSTSMAGQFSVSRIGEFAHFINVAVPVYRYTSRHRKIGFKTRLL